MTVDQVFKEAESLSGDKITEFWVNISKSLLGNKPYLGIEASEIKAFLTLNEDKYTCACGNQSFNCICYSDAE